MDQPVIDAAEEITPAWLTEALGTAGHELAVVAARAERIGVGQVGTTYRVELEYDGAAGPATLVVKAAGGDDAARARVSIGYAAEVGFYTQLASRVAVRTPRCWYGAIADDAASFTLLLDDLAPFEPGDQMRGCTIDEARAGVANLVGLHAPVWNDATLFERDFLVRSDPDAAEFLGAVLAEATEQFVARYDARLDPADIETLRASARSIVAWQTTRTEPFSVLHGALP